MCLSEVKLNYDRRHIELLREKPRVSALPFVKFFVVLGLLVFLLSVIH